MERKDSMTEKGRIEAMLRHEKPDRIPVWPFAYAGFAAVYGKYSVAEMYNNANICLEAERKASQDFEWAFTPMLGYASYGAWEFGGDIKWPNSEFQQAPSVTLLPVQTEEDIWNLRIPDVATAGIIPIQRTFYQLSQREWRDNQPFNVMVSINGPFNTASNICGIDKLCKWLIKKPDVVHHLLRLVTDHITGKVDYWHSILGVDGILPFTGEAAANANVISAKQFEEFVLPYLQEICQKILSVGYQHIYCHLCGEQNVNLPSWSKILFGNPGIISIGHEIDIDTAAKYFPNDIIVGNIQPSIIQSGTPEQVYELARICIEKGKHCPGGFALSPGCELPPLSPVENVRMLVRAAKDFGWYH